MKPERLASVDAIRTLRRAQVDAEREKALGGEPFALVHSDEAEEVFALLGIGIQVYNPWNFIIISEGKAAHFSKVLHRRGYPGAHFFALGYAATLEPEQAPWGGLPRPALVVGSTRDELELRVTELWAREYGCEFFPIDFNMASAAKHIPGDRWWERVRTDWPELVDAPRLDLRVTQLRELIERIEALSGRDLDEAELAALLERVNAQMDDWDEANNLIGSADQCPVSLRDQLATYQMMWSRGTQESIDAIAAYRDEVAERVASGRGAYAPMRLRIFYASMDAEPRFHDYLRDQHAAAIVGGPYTTVPVLYARELYDDPLRTLAARNLFLFGQHDTDWWVAQAEKLRADIVITVEPPGRYPSMLAQAYEAAGLPCLSMPSTKNDDKSRQRIDEFFAERITPG